MSEELTQESTSRFANTSKWRIHYNEAGSGHPIVMLHGSGPGATGWSNFHQNLKVLSAKYRVLAVDFPGWGQSDPVEPGTRDNTLAVKLLLDELGIDKAALIGNSMGGRAAISSAVEYPERTSHLITMGAGCPGVNIYSAAGLSEGIKVLAETYEDPSPANFARLLRIMLFDSSFATEELFRQRSESALANRAHLENWLKDKTLSAGWPAGYEARLAQLAVPALFMHGRDDRTVTMEHSLRLVSLVPKATLIVFNNCGHWAQVEHAAKFNWLVDGFLSNQAA
ncbi:MAG TPA: alpha/beta hydrolase [Chloroflexota bacterium]|nr:alpha/beta hydrolase [Chloroflexota bacterium]